MFDQNAYTYLTTAKEAAVTTSYDSWKTHNPADDHDDAHECLCCDEPVKVDHCDHDAAIDYCGHCQEHSCKTSNVQPSCDVCGVPAPLGALPCVAWHCGPCEASEGPAKADPRGLEVAA